jgi:mono/diheme cytochrome c family protein
VTQPFRIRRLAAALALSGAAICSTGAFAQMKAPSRKKTDSNSLSSVELASVQRGLVVYKDRCAICHFDESNAKKIGPGLKGIYNRGKYADRGKVDDASMGKWILDGGKNMPPFKSVLNSGQVRDLITYLKTLR